jgi:hypothetical protein
LSVYKQAPLSTKKPPLRTGAEAGAKGPLSSQAILFSSRSFSP